MYKLLLCWRYLRTRWIALASVVSVTLGVATLIVVNSVMDGFTSEMHDRIHGILSDVVVQSHASYGIANPGYFESEIRKTLGDRLQGVTTVVTVPAMLTFSVGGQSHTQQINLIGIDTKTYASVSDFSQYLLHPSNQQQLEFVLREQGYAPDRLSLVNSGWAHRRSVARTRKQIQEEQERNRQLREQIRAIEPLPGTPTDNSAPDNVNVQPGPPDTQLAVASQPSLSGPTLGGPTIGGGTTGAYVFDAEKDVHSGIVIGIGIGATRYRNQDGKVEEHHFVRPGDDVSVTFPGAGTPPRPIDSNFTVVDLYESKMSEYDSTFAFVSIEELQRLRGMIDPQSGMKAVTSIQIKLKEGVDLDQARDDLRSTFPADASYVHVESWKDSQGPLLAAVQLETTILNILLFMIIAVAGFGILATFFMIVVEKTRDIGILKSLGAPGSGVASIFLGYGLLLGAVGSGAGVILGLLFVWNINRIARVIEMITGREVFDPTVYYFTTIPTIIHPVMIMWVAIGAMLIAVLASVLPSIRAAKMHPVEALRYE